jgi:hypothetical protein
VNKRAGVVASNGAITASEQAALIEMALAMMFIDELFAVETAPSGVGLSGPAWSQARQVRQSKDPSAKAKQLAKRYVHRDTAEGFRRGVFEELLLRAAGMPELGRFSDRAPPPPPRRQRPPPRADFPPTAVGPHG